MLLVQYVERPVLNALLAPTITAARLSELTLAATIQERTSEAGARAEELKRRIADLDRAIDRLVSAVAAGGEAEGLLSGINAKEAERRRLRQDLLLIEAETPSAQRAPLGVAEVVAILEELRGLAAAGERREMRALVRLFVDHVTVDGETVTITYLPQARVWMPY
jgi:hypothetical protein